MAGYPVIDPSGVDILNVDGSTTHYNQGDVVPIAKLISRRYSWLVERGYLSETETGFGSSGGDADTLDGFDSSYFAPKADPTFTGVATFQGYIDLVSAQLDSDLKTVSVTTPLLLDAFDAAFFRSAEYTVQLSQGTNYAMCKLLLIHNSTDVGITEYGIAEIGTSIPFTFTTNFSAGILELLITCSNANITTVGVKYSRVLYDS